MTAVSDLMIFVYHTPNAAFLAGESLASLQREAGVEPEDVVVVTKDAGGRVSVHQSTDMVSGRPIGGGRWGALLGMMFLDPQSVRSGAKGLAGQFLDTGLEHGFLQAVSQGLEKGGAAVGLRVRLLGADRVKARIKGLKGTPKILQTRLSPATEDALEDMQDQIPEQVLRGGA